MSPARSLSTEPLRNHVDVPLVYSERWARGVGRRVAGLAATQPVLMLLRPEECLNAGSKLVAADAAAVVGVQQLKRALNVRVVRAAWI